MDRYLIAAGVAALALGFASPAAAGGVHHLAKGAPAGARRSAAPHADARATALAGDRALEDKIEQLTGVISDLSERLAALEQKLGSSDDKDDQDADDDSADDDVSLASARRGGQPRLPHRSAHGLHRAAPQVSSPA